MNLYSFPGFIVVFYMNYVSELLYDLWLKNLHDGGFEDTV